MTGVFSDIELEWGGNVFTIESNRVMGALARIEQHITLGELQAFSQKGTAPIAKLCMAFADALRYAGARVTDDEVYAQAFEGEEQQQAIMVAIMQLLQMMLPASARVRLEAEMDKDTEPKADEGNQSAAVAASSKKPIRQRSRKANG